MKIFFDERPTSNDMLELNPPARGERTRSMKNLFGLGFRRGGVPAALSAFRVRMKPQTLPGESNQPFPLPGRRVPGPWRRAGINPAPTSKA